MEKIGEYEYIIKLNGSPLLVDELNYLPVKSTFGGILYIRDVAQVRDGFVPQTNIVRVMGIEQSWCHLKKLEIHQH